MARCYWVKRGIFGLQTENLEGERETYPNDLRRLLATVCDRGCNNPYDGKRILTVAHMGVIRTQTERLREGIPGEPAKELINEVVSRKFLADFR